MTTMTTTTEQLRGDTRGDVTTALLHYGTGVSIRLEPASARQVMEAIGAHATRGGWVTVTDVDGVRWSFLVTPGVPIWIRS